MNWKPWLHGLISATITGAASTGADFVIDGDSFDWHKALTKSAIMGFFGAYAYLKQSPLPPMGN